MDVITAFLNPEVKKGIWVQFPEELGVPKRLKKNKDTQIALRLKKGLYGLKSPKRSYSAASEVYWCKSDPCLHVRLEQDGKSILSFEIIATYVDDLILTSNSSDLLELIEQELMANYKMTDLGDLS